MNQLLKKFALLTACAALALCFATVRPAQAQMVAASGTGEHLLFAYWSADMYTNTNVNIHSPLGVRADTEMANVVHVRVRNTSANNATNTLVSFNICLMPGDSWTATLSMGNLMVGDPGQCDGNVQPQPGGRGSHMVSTPMKGDMVSLGDAESGFLEAWLRPTGGLKDGTGTSVGVNDQAPDNAMPRYISGSAMLVSPMSGFSSSYNATALTGCGAAAGDRIGGTNGTTADDHDGCWTVADAEDGAPIMGALRGGTDAASSTNDILTGRWTAIDNEDVMSHTKVVLTFPVNHLNYPAIPSGLAEAVPAGTDLVSIIAFDDKGAIALNNREVMLGMAVNMCKFMPAGMMDDDMDMGTMMPMLSCNDMEVGALSGMAGGFRLFNNTANVLASPTTLAAATGVETADLAVTDGTGGQDPAEALSAIGLVFSYFEGTNGMQYDQVTPIQSIDVIDAAADL